MPRRKRRSNNPAGRPSSGLSEARALVSGPALLLAAMAHKADARGITIAEAWRRAARVWLGWREVSK